MKIQYWLCFLILFSKDIFAQEKPFTFNLETGNKDVSIGKITCITQDTWGYMWFLDQGNSQLVRYDGYRMKVFKHNPSDSNSIDPNGFECFAADSSGNIWLPVRGGIDKINSATGDVTHYKLKESFGDAIIVDHAGTIWAGSHGIYQFDPKTGNTVYYHHQENDPTSLSEDAVRVLYEDKEGAIWAGNGLPFNPGNNGGLNKLNRSTGKFTRYMHNPADPHSIINNRVRAILQDSRGTFWIGTQGDGLQIMDQKTGSFERLTYSPNHPEKLSRPPVRMGDLADHITFIKEDISGNIWIGTYHQGITRYDPLSKKVTHFISDTLSANGFPDSTTWAAFTSRDGSLWISTEISNLLYRVDPFRKSIVRISTGNTANSFVADNNENLWVGTGGNGILKFDQQYHVIAHFKHNASDLSSQPDNHGLISAQSGSNKILAGFYSGTRIIDENTNKFYKINSNSSLFKDSSQIGFVSALEDKQGIDWFATWGQGLLRYDPKDSLVKQFIPNPSDSFSISSNSLNHLLEDRKGRLWVAGQDGVHWMDRKTEKFKNYLPNTFVTSIYQDSKNNIWAGSEKGLFIYDEKIDQFYPFFDPGFDISTLALGGIIEDNNHNLWMVSVSALIKLNPLIKKYSIYGEKYGFGKNSMEPFTKPFKNNKGQLLIGNGDGFSIIDPKEFEQKSNFGISITDFMLDNIPVMPGRKSPIQKPVEELNDITLQYNQNNIAFNFSAMDYRNPESISYFTMLEGYDNTWRKATDERASRYFGLPNGRYVYHIRALNKDGEQAEKNITIVINPPWWKTWWAYILYAVLIIAALWAITKWRTRALEEEKISLERKVLERTQELKKEKETVETTLAELKSTQSQLIQSEKMASLGELTAGIAHEIQNPLNFVNNFAEVNNELIEEMNNESDIHEVMALANSIKQNNEKISFHGKRADAIVKDMLQHSKQSKGIKEPTDVNALCNEYLKLSYHGLRAKDKDFNSNIRTDFDETLEKIMVVPQDIGRVLLNLFNNAFYAVNEKAKSSTADYSPMVSVKTGKKADKTLITVSDNGSGISKTIINKIFQPFFTTKPAGKGTGLGLSLSYDIITKEHDGKMIVESKEGEGTDFIIQLQSV
jgi:signal transduction histidine kinase/ligand-binding sensor domain-containing protein